MRELLAVLLGGAVGTALRLGIDTAIPHGDDAFPLSTLAINTLGAGLLGVLVARLWPRVPAWQRAGLGAGLLGSFTTFSAFAVSVVALSAAGEWMLAALYLVATLGLGWTAAALGLSLGRPREPEVTE